MILLSVLLTTLVSLFSNTSMVLGGNINGEAVNNTLTIGYLWPWSHGWPGGPYSGSAIVVALEEVERRKLLPGYTIGEG